MGGPGFYAALANSMVAGEATEDAIAARLAQTLGHRWRWIRPLARRYVARFGGAMRPRRRTIAQFLITDEGLSRALRLHRKDIRIANWVAPAGDMQPHRAAKNWPVPAIETVGALAEWLQVTPSELEWFADLKRMISRREDGFEGPLSHYHYRILAKPGGDVRLIEAPKERLKKMQRQILADVLEKIPVHPAVHGFRRGRSIKTFAAPHVGQRVVIRMDLRDFFPSISAPRVQALFRTAGYPERVADLLGGICSNATPRTLWTKKGSGIDPLRMAEARQHYAWPHLPQGAPSSPALANICAYRVDCRLTCLAEASGAVYTRYADDLAFSGGMDFERCAERFAIRAAAILLEEGFAVHHRKTRIMRQGVRQYLAGIVVNEHVNVIRRDYDALKATLTNCVRHGWESQNREGHVNFREHLAGRVSFVEMVNAKRGAKLRALFERIRW
ncbi:MAG: RNA-directed DNA polymerase [Acidobacteria bacterium]|nr:RNA-directed DNA polymerase [Acidobacteriota bacterium]